MVCLVLVCVDLQSLSLWVSVSFIMVFIIIRFLCMLGKWAYRKIYRIGEVYTVALASCSAVSYFTKTCSYVNNVTWVILTRILILQWITNNLECTINCFVILNVLLLQFWSQLYDEDRLNEVVYKLKAVDVFLIPVLLQLIMVGPKYLNESSCLLLLLLLSNVFVNGPVCWHNITNL